MKKTLIEIVIVLLLSSFSASAFAWYHVDDTEDLDYERCGPRMGTLLCHLYPDDTAEWAALKAGEIDITDWPLSKTVHEELSQPPYDATIGIANYGPEYGLFLLDLNSNDNQNLDNPPNPAYPNPVGDRNNATGNPLIRLGDGKANNRNPMSDVNLRRAIGYLIDRPGLIADPTIGAGFGFPMYTTMPPAQPKYVLDVYGDPTMPWAWSYDPAAAAALLDANGFPINTATGYRYWDRNSDSIEQADEWVEILFYIRSDHAGRSHIGTVLVAEMAAINLRVNPQYATSGTCFVKVMVEKDFHMYTGGWSLGVDPDHLILWSWDYYWHPGFCYDYGGHNDPDFNAAADGIMYANDQAEAVMYAMMAQEAQARHVLGIPLYCASGNKAFYKTNTGGNPGDASEGEEWENSFVNMAGYGIDNVWTSMNMHTEGPNGAPYYQPGVIDYGFKVPEIKMLNPVYASWLFDWNVLGLCYDSLLVRNASDLGQFTAWVASYFDLGTYIHPTLGTCTKVRFSMRQDVFWQDGTPLTMADVHFTFVELKKILGSRGLPTPWWWSNVQDILSFSILDPYTFEVLLGVKSYWALGWIGSNIILPMHIWRPIVQMGDPQADQPDPDLVGSGVWMFAEYNEVAKYVKLDANKYHPGGHIDDHIGFTFIPLTNTKRHPPFLNSCQVWVYNLHMRYSMTVNVTAQLYHEDEFPIILPMEPRAELNRYNDDIWAKLYFRIYDTEYVIGSEAGYEYGCWAFIAFVNATINKPGSSYREEDAWFAIYWATRDEDIAGSTLYDDLGYTTGFYALAANRAALPSPDLKVDIKDVALAAKGFGSYPGHERWVSIADISRDYKIDIKDIAAIAKQFGWLPP